MLMHQRVREIASDSWDIGTKQEGRLPQLYNSPGNVLRLADCARAAHNPVNALESVVRLFDFDVNFLRARPRPNAAKRAMATLSDCSARAFVRDCCNRAAHPGTTSGLA